MKDIININISVKSIIWIIAILMGIWVLFLIKTVLFYIILATVLAIALEPYVNWLHKRKLPYSLSVILIIVIAVAGTFGLMTFAIIPFVYQLQLIIYNFPDYISSLGNYFGFTNEYMDDFNQNILFQLSQRTGSVIEAMTGFFNLVLGGITIVFFMIYILLDISNLRRLLLSFVKKNKQRDIAILIAGIEHKIGNWLRGQLLMMLVIGITSFIGLVIMGVDYALALAVLAGILEIIPVVGPIIALVPAAIVGFSDSSLTGFGVIALYLLIQQFQNNVVIPKVMNKMLGFNPLYVIVALMIGAKLFGFLGLVLAIPISIVAFEIIQYIYKIDLSHLTHSHRPTKSPDKAG
jgi:predicted PurR-regulated permease PerM